MEDKKKKLRPVVYTANHFKSGHQNTTQQMFLLKALKVTQDPKKLREMIGVRSVAEVYKTLDKLAMRKEYHEALASSGVSFDFIVRGIKDIAQAGEKDADRLKAYQTLLKSVGMDKYDAEGASSGTWEEVLLKTIEDSKKTGQNALAAPEVYEVKQPVVPDSVRITEAEEAEITGSVYDTK